MTELRKLLDEIINRTQPFTLERRMVVAMRKSLSMLKDHPDAEAWCAETVRALRNIRASVPFVVDAEQWPQGLVHVGPDVPGAPKFKPFGQ